ncbi:MAG: 6-phosphogluconate dehydrogenase NAD-binding [Proteobacteria bacterium]|nr:6-phosphogluconate dehydrogenase NAD-binding [Pseudomonadota bacterium]
MNVSVLGLGIIGSIWAKNLMADGHAVRCWNRTPKDFPNFYPSVHEAVEGAEAIFVVVADPPAVQSVLEQICPVLAGGQMLIQSSTISARWTKIFAEMVHKTGADYLEAPFTGSKPAAEQRQTIFYLGGDAALIEKARPLLAALSKSIQHIGPMGSASSLKLAMNLNIAGVGQALCESLSLARAAGISDDVYFAALAQNVSRSGLSDLKEGKLRQRDYAPQFSLKHMGKDLRLALETAAELPLALDQTQNLLANYERGMAAGWQDDDFIGLMRLVADQDSGNKP